jgi:hypothetical protein
LGTTYLYEFIYFSYALLYHYQRLKSCKFTTFVRKVGVFLFYGPEDRGTHEIMEEVYGLGVENFRFKATNPI